METDFTKYGIEITNPTLAGVDDELSQPLSERIANFFAPTSVDVLSDIFVGKRPSLRSSFGSALELGSLAVPGGAATRGIAAGARALPKAATIGGQLLQTTQKLGGQALRTGKLGAISGALFGTGQALGDEELGAKEIATTGAIAAGFGGIAGGTGDCSAGAGRPVGILCGSDVCCTPLLGAMF